MQVNAGRLQILTVAAMLVLISGGIAAYAQNQSSSTTGATGVPSSASASAPTTNGNGSTPLQMQPADSTTTFTTTMTSTTTITKTSTTSTTSTTTGNGTLCQQTPPKVGRLVLPITATGSQTSSSISFSNSKGCLASITTVGGIFSVQIILRYAKPVTQYNVVLLANGTSYTLGNMVTGPDGSGQMQNQVLLKPGTYVVMLQLFDTSSNPGQSTLVLQTGQGTIVSPPFPTATSSQPPNQGNQGGQGQTGQHK